MREMAKEFDKETEEWVEVTEDFSVRNAFRKKGLTINSDYMGSHYRLVMVEAKDLKKDQKCLIVEQKVPS